MIELPKVFQIGFNKCGTRTLHYFFSQNGIQSVHWQGGDLAKAIFRNLEAGRSLIEGYSHFTAFTDMEHVPQRGGQPLEAFRLFRELAREFPNAVFILNTRDRENWIASRLGHRHGGLVERWKLIYGVESAQAVADRWREDWDTHHQAVTDFFGSGSNRLLIFDVERDLPEALACAMPEFALDITKYELRGRTRTPYHQLPEDMVRPAQDNVQLDEVAAAHPKRKRREIENENFETPSRDPLGGLRKYGRVLDEVATIMDVGVHKGTPSLYETFRGKRFILVDPQRDCELLLQKPPSNYTFVNKAAGPCSGRMTLGAQGSKSSLVERTDLTRASGPSEHYEVEVTTLDQIIEDLSPAKPLGLKVDTEGFELDVLGGLNRYSSDFRFIICETSVRRRFINGYTFSDLVLVMKSKGFEFFNILNEVKERPAFYDVLFLPADHALFS